MDLRMDLWTNTDADIMLAGYKACKHKNLNQGEYFNRGNQLHFIQTLLQELLSRGTSNLIFSLSEQNCVRLVGSGLNEKELQILAFLHVIW